MQKRDKDLRHEGGNTLYTVDVDRHRLDFISMVLPSNFIPEKVYSDCLKWGLPPSMTAALF